MCVAYVWLVYVYVCMHVVYVWLVYVYVYMRVAYVWLVYVYVYVCSICVASVCLCVHVYVCSICVAVSSPSPMWVSGIELKLGFRGKCLHLLSHPTSSLSWIFRPLLSRKTEVQGSR